MNPDKKNLTLLITLSFGLLACGDNPRCELIEKINTGDSETKLTSVLNELGENTFQVSNDYRYEWSSDGCTFAAYLSEFANDDFRSKQHFCTNTQLSTSTINQFTQAKTLKDIEQVLGAATKTLDGKKYSIKFNNNEQAYYYIDTLGKVTRDEHLFEKPCQ